MKKMVFGVAIVVAFFIGTACSVPGLAAAYSDNVAATAIIYEPFIDKQTGVNYWVIRSQYNSDMAMCPRYNADGTLYTGQ